MEIPKSKAQAEYEFRARQVIELFARLQESEQIAVHEYAMEMYIEQGRNESLCLGLKNNTREVNENE